MRRRSASRTAAAAAALAALALAAQTDLASAAGSQSVPVSAQPATGTPHFPAATNPVEQIRQLVQCGPVMYAVGTFSTVEQGGNTYTRNNAFSFSATAPFTMTSWNPNVNGEVNTITFNSGRCGDAYLGGLFTQVGTTKASNIAEVSTTGTGKVVTSFGHAANSEVDTLASYQGHVLAGGTFTRINGGSADPYLVSLNAKTGKNDGFLALGISGHYSFTGAAPNGTRVFNQQLSHSQKLDLFEGDFTTVAGKRRHQIFMVNLASRPRATLTSWTSPRFDGSKGYPPGGYYYNCFQREPFYIRAAAWSPDDSTVYVADTGFHPWQLPAAPPSQGLCDAAAAFTVNAAHPALKWINYTGCDSLYSVAAGTAAVYFGGHERWSENPGGCDAQGPGGIPAPGMEGLNPATGALLLNSSNDALYTRGRGLGADDMLLTSAGLWIASDNFDGTQDCGGVTGLSGICFLPYPKG